MTDYQELRARLAKNITLFSHDQAALLALVDAKIAAKSDAAAVVKYYADWLLDAIAVATQNRALLRGDPAEDAVLTEAILLNGAKAIELAMAKAGGQ